MNKFENKAPVVSIIIPAYRVAQYIGETLNSVLAQLFSDYEIIVVNDGSPDSEELERVLHPYKERIVYIKQENKGVSAARNTGIRASRGDLIAFLDADDIWEPDYLSVQLRYFKDNPATDVVYSDAVLFGDSAKDGKRWMDYCPSKGDVTIKSLLAEECNVMLSAAVVRREVLVEVGMFDERIRYTEDFDLWLRVVKHGGLINYHRNAPVRHRIRSGSTSASDPVWLYEQIIGTLKRIADTWSLTNEESVVLRERVKFNEAMVHQFKAKKAFVSGDTKTAIRELQDANQFFQKRKYGFLIFLMSVAPRLLLAIHNARGRLSERPAAEQPDF